MRPLFHPAIEDISVESILHALSDPVRVAIYGDILCQDYAQSCSTFLRVLDRPIPKSTLSQHFRILRESGLIRSERHGVQLKNSSRYAELEGRFPGLIEAIVKAHRIQMDEDHSSKATAKSSAKRAVKRSRRRVVRDLAS
jgi:DNA-binding transcriptional ArsR family regulator